MNVLHTFHDGSTLVRLPMSEILATPVWKGNRILDRSHASKISSSVKDIQILDSGYQMIVYKEYDNGGVLVEQKCLIDGQHRAEVVRQRWAQAKQAMESLGVSTSQDFPVLCRIKTVETESDAIVYFNALNNTKPLQFDEDVNLQTNRILSALEGEFNQNKKKPFLRHTKMMRPYIYTDSLRKALEPYVTHICAMGIPRFVERVRTWNDTHIALPSKDGTAEAAKKLGFFLGYRAKFPWILECLPTQSP